MMIKKYKLAVLLIVVLSPIMFLIFWLMPLFALDAVVIDSQMGGEYTDANFYLYHAWQNCSKPYELHNYDVTWSSIGVVGYLSAVCHTTGMKYMFIFSNIAIFSGCFYFYLKKISIYQGGLSTNTLLFSWALMPYSMIQILAPGKEIFGVSAILLIGSTFFIKKLSSKVLIIIIALLIAAVSRPHQSVLLIVIYLVVLFLHTRPYFKIMMLVGLLIIGDMLMTQYIGTSYRDLYFDGSGMKTGVSLLLGQITYSDNIIAHTLMAPIRILAVVVGPIYTVIFNVSAIDDFNYWVFRDLQLRLRLFDTLVITIGLWVAFTGNPVAKKIGLFSLVYLFFISFFGTAEKNRYIYELTPLLLPMLALITKKNRISAKET